MHSEAREPEARERDGKTRARTRGTELGWTDRMAATRYLNPGTFDRHVVQSISSFFMDPNAPGPSYAGVWTLKTLWF